jgi:hypothetical protein
MQTVKRAVRKIIPRPVQTPPNPVEAEDSAYSAICSVYDEQGHASQRLVELGIDAVERTMKDVDMRGTVWPGEEICLIGGLVLAMRPKLVVEIGESDQRAAEVVKKYLEGGRFENVERVGAEIAGAELILVSGGGDGAFAQRVLEELGRVKFASLAVVVLNDTRRWEMLRFVREIRHSKLDMTSFGRWSGTMLVEIA